MRSGSVRCAIAAAASANTSVCRSTSASVVAGRHERHVVERRQEDAAVQRPEVDEPVEQRVAAGRRLAAVARALGPEQVLDAAAEPRHVPRQRVRRRSTPARPPRSARRARSSARTPRRSGPRRASRASRRARARSPRACRRSPPTSDSSRGIALSIRVATSSREPVRRARDPAADRLADGEHVRLEAVRARVPARPGTERVGLVDDEERAVLARRRAQGVVEARAPAGRCRCS